jgi:2-O-(6-phospho-alpha-D-mannosyl)-D-glycerate hydrolase
VPENPRQAFVVTHTHWDREWYLPYHRFRVRLMDIVLEVLERLENDDDFEHFLMDGQAIILEDYLAVHPEDRLRVRALVAKGALSIGPWYVLPDEFLVSGEATVRNLLIGHRVCAPLGGAQKAGYLPDTFGHIAQMPQILRRAGIDSFIYTRGNGDELEDLGHEYIWEGPDGSEVLAINQYGGYCCAGALGHEELWHAHTRRDLVADRAVEKVREMFEGMSRLGNGDIVLMNNGCDHLPPQREFGPILEALRKAFPETTFAHTDLAAYLAAVREAGFVKNRYRGELLGGRYHLILSGVWSARMPLKQRNDEAQQLLAGLTEPAAAYAHFLLGRRYPQELIDGAWKLLLENHPHDSICGCSTDEVHREMDARFDGVIQTGEQLAADTLEFVTPSFGRRAEHDRDTIVTAFNPLPVSRTEVVERTVVLQPFGYEVDELGLFDGAGNAVPYEVVEKQYVERFWGIDYRAALTRDEQRERFDVYRERFGSRILRGEDRRDDSDCFLTIRFEARDLPALGHANYALRESAGATLVPERSGNVTLNGETIENDLVAVTLHPDGTFDLTDKATETSYPGLGRLEDTEDVGDEYDYSPSAETKTVRSSGASGRVEVIEAGALRAALRATFTWSLPARVAEDRRTRSDDLVDCDVETTVRLTAGSPLVEVNLTFVNRAEDHRLRVEFPTPMRASRVFSDGQFLVHKRPIDPPVGVHWTQPPPGTVPQQDFTLLKDGGLGFAVLNRGLPEIQASRDKDERTTLSLTLLRCVGWLSRDDFETRRCSNAGPTLYTPDAQCPGKHRFSFAVLPFTGRWLDVGVKATTERYRNPVVTKQGIAESSIPGGRGLFEKRSRRTSITAIKKHEERDTLIVRLYNLDSEPVEETLAFGLDVKAAWRVDLLEYRLETLSPTLDEEIVVTLKPHEIATVEVEFERA